jgi:hypothetical protein
MALHIVVRWTIHLLGISFNIFPVIRSYPGAFFGLKFSCVMFWISFGVRNLIDCVICSGSFSFLLISVSFLSALQKCSLFLYHFIPKTGPRF